MNVEVKTKVQPSRKARLAAVGSVLVAFLASQHHFIHMFILLVTFGSAGISFMSAFPVLRRSMLLLSLLMMAVTLWQMWYARLNRSMAILGGISVALTLGLVLWSIAQFGL
jgi:hypothetical protein